LAFFVCGAAGGLGSLALTLLGAPNGLAYFAAMVVAIATLVALLFWNGTTFD